MSVAWPRDIYIYTFRSASRFHVPLLCVVVPTNATERMLLISFSGSQRNEQGLYTMRVEATSCFWRFALVNTGQTSSTKL